MRLRNELEKSAPEPLEPQRVAVPRGFWSARSVAALLVLLVLPAVLEAQSVQATVDRNQISADQQILLTIRVEGSQEARPRVPELPDFQMVSGGQRTEMSIVNGKVSASVSHQYILIPRATGEFTIPAIDVEIEGQTYASRPFKVRVTEASAKPTEDRDTFIVARVSDDTPWVGEQVIYTWRFYRRVRVSNANLTPLEFPGLVSEELGDVREYQTTVNGVQYVVSEIRRALFAQRAGKVTIPPSELSIGVQVSSGRRSLFDDFIGRSQVRQRVLRSDQIELDVRALPTPPTDFSGLVGEFTIGAALSRDQLRVGESSTLEVTVSGVGNAQFISEPSLPPLDLFKTYDDKPTSSLERTGTQLRGAKSYRKAIVPTVAGELEVPSVELVYFDPDAERFERVRTEVLRLDVSPGEGEEDLMLTETVAPSTGKVAVRVLANDIVPIRRGIAVSRGGAGGPPGVWLATWLTPPLGFLALLLVRRRQLRYQLDTGLRRREGAIKSAVSALEAVPREGGDARARAAGFSRALRGFVGDRLGVEGGALTPAEADQLLRAAGAEESTARRMREVLDRLEAAQYGAGTNDPSLRVDSLIDLVRSLGAQVEGKSRPAFWLFGGSK